MDTERIFLAPRMRPFVKAVLWGTLAGAALPLIAAVTYGWIEISDALNRGRPLQLGFHVALLLAPLGIAFVVVTVASVIVGLPLTAVLARWRAESVGAYSLWGGGTGFLLPSILLVLEGSQHTLNNPLALFGALSGCVTGWVWGKSRMARHSDPGAQ